MERHRVAILIPAFNEADTISEVIRSVSPFGAVIVIDDGSLDGTPREVLSTGAYLIKHHKNLGYDAALNSGFKKALDIGAEVIITFDADGQHDPDLIKKFIDAEKKGADIVVGVRDKKQRLAENFFSFYSLLLYGIADPLCGMKAYRISVYKNFGYFDTLNSIGTELMISAVKNKFKIAQIPMQVRKRKDNARFGNCFFSNVKIIIALIKIIFFAK